MNDHVARVGLVTCPCFAFGSPPLSLASLQAVLVNAGVPATCFDLDFMLMRDDPPTFHQLYALYNIGHSEDVDRVQFVTRPRLTLLALFQEAFPEAERAEHAADLVVLQTVEAYLGGWARRISEGVDVLMCSVYVSSLLPTLFLAKAFKALHPEGKVVLGGPGVGAPEIQEFALRLGFIDFCATGEGERIAPPLAAALLSGEPGHDVAGVSFLHEGTIVVRPPPPLMDLCDLPLPDFRGLPVPGHPLHHYRSNPNVNTRWFGTALPIATTRGCVMRCTFCSETNYWQKFRFRDPSTVVAEIQELQRRWGVHQFLFGDSLLNGSGKWLEAFADSAIASDLGAQFLFAYMRPTRLPRPLLEKLAKAGFRLFSFGLETASQHILDRLDKGTTVAEAEQVILDALDVGISVNVSILCGFPDETPDQVLESVRFVQRLRRRVLALPEGLQREQMLTVHAGSTLRVEPNSRMYQNPTVAGIALLPDTRQLPTPLAHLEQALAPLLQRWSSSVALHEARSRSTLLRDTINCEPNTVFLSEPLDSWLTEDTVLAPVRDAVILSDAENRNYLASGSQILAQLDPLSSRVWQQVREHRTLGQMRRHLIGEAPPEELDALLRQALVRLLMMRHAYVDDFAQLQM